MIRALAYLRLCSLRNRIRTRLRRLKQPKYLVGAIVGLVYLWAVFFRHLVGGHLGPRGNGAALEGATGEMGALIEVAGAWGLLVFLALFWILPSRRAALDFTEAEIQFLFPAPISRRGLLHYKLLSGQLGLLFTSLMMSLFTGRLLRMDGAWMALIGWWLALLLLQMHALGASFARTLLLDWGLPRWKSRLAVALGLLALVAATIAWGWRALSALPFPGITESADLTELREWFEALSATPPMVWVLTPLRWVVRMTLTRDPMEFVRALVPTLGLVALHYVWVMQAKVAFEEASVNAARVQAERLGARRIGGGVVRPGRSRSRHVFRLNPTGAPWVALTWKNLVAAGAMFRGRMLVLFVALVPPLVIFGNLFLRGTKVAPVIGILSAMMLAMSCIIGPAAARFDLRQDLVTSWDVLKSLPLVGWQVVLGELMAPWLVLTAIQWLLAILAVSFLPELPGVNGIGVGARIVSLGVAAVLAPALSIVGLCLQNAAALLFPAWVLQSPGQPRGGFEVMGQQMIMLAGQMVTLILALTPAVLAGATVFALLAWGFGPWVAAIPAALAAVVVLLAEAALGVVLLGRVWEASDLSRETNP